MRVARILLLVGAVLCAVALRGGGAGPEQAVAPARTFIHPGLLNSQAELEIVRARIRAGAEPWRTQFERMAGSRFAVRSWAPRPRAVVDARSDDAGIENDDATAAYTQALMGYFTGDQTYSRNAAAILNAWSATLQRHTSRDRQEEIVAGWCGAVFPLAAEILRANYPAWTAADRGRFAAMLDRAFVPLLWNGNPKYNGNWELAMINALLCIGVANDDAATFERGLMLWRRRVPAFLYLRSDGPTPRRPVGAPDLATDAAIAAYWFHPGRYFDGLCQETGRDYGHHVQEGMATLVNGAEIAFHQGVDLYGENEARITAALEFHAGALLGRPVPAEYFPAGFIPADLLPTWAIAYHHFHGRRGLALPNTGELLRAKIDALPAPAIHLDMAWESLTHAVSDSPPVEVLQR